MQTSFFEKLSHWIRVSTFLKLLSIGFLFIILMIPKSMVEGLVSERENLRNQAVSEVSNKWGLEQTIGPPVITVPYRYLSKDEKGFSEYKIGYAHFLPDQNKFEVDLKPEKRYRGIYMVVLYKASIRVQGILSAPAFQELSIPEQDYLWDDAQISFAVSDLKGLSEQIKFSVNQENYAPNPGLPNKDLFTSGLSFKFPIKPGSDHYTYQFDLQLNGSSSINFLPYAKTNIVRLKANWHSPSFQGDYLPIKHLINKESFEADWKILHLNRNYAQQGIGNYIQEEDQTEYGVKLMLPVDEYSKIIRSIKYCAMFILLTFLTFFFIEIINKKRIHPIQYLLVGFAIILFYVLLLSISEHLKFNQAYLIGSLSTIALLGFYVSHVFANTKLSTIFTVVLAMMYLFFYSLLQLEDYALLMGSSGLFIILTIIMYLTRKIDWYNISQD